MAASSRPRRGRDQAPEASQALDRLVAALEQSRYARDPETFTADRFADDLALVEEGIEIGKRMMAEMLGQVEEQKPAAAAENGESCPVEHEAAEEEEREEGVEPDGMGHVAGASGATIRGADVSELRSRGQLQVTDLTRPMEGPTFVAGEYDIQGRSRPGDRPGASPCAIRASRHRRASPADGYPRGR